MAIAFPDIQLSSARLVKDLGLKEFRYAERYAATGSKGQNAKKQTWVWTWNQLTWDQTNIIEDFFDTLAGGAVNWTPPGKTAPLKFRVIGSTLGIDYPEDSFDTGSVQVQMGQDFRNGS